jgi:hypothetical protein
VGAVDTLWALDLLLGRAAAVGADFILAGPVSMWLKGLTPPPREKRFIIVTSRDNADLLLRALKVGAHELEWEPQWEGVEGRLVRLELRGMIVEVLVDPVIKGRIINASSLARDSQVIIIDKYVARLAPTWFDLLLAEALEGDEQ